MPAMRAFLFGLCLSFTFPAIAFARRRALSDKAARAHAHTDAVRVYAFFIRTPQALIRI